MNDKKNWREKVHKNNIDCGAYKEEKSSIYGNPSSYDPCQSSAILTLIKFSKKKKNFMKKR